MNQYSFAPATEDEMIVFGAKRPGHPVKVKRSIGPDAVNDWILFMKNQGIQRVCCLLPIEQLDYYVQSLIAAYKQAFGDHNVCNAPIQDYHLSDATNLKQTIIPFLYQSNDQQMPVVVHCSGGSGRTGHILAAWLTHARDYSIQDALEAIRSPRNPLEAVELGNASRQQLEQLLTPTP